MKKYKLIKEYPGSPDLGTTLEYESGYYLKKNIRNTAIRREQIENHPEFWEEVIEKNYEILSFKRQPSEKFGDNLFKIRNDDGYYTWDWTNFKDTEEDLIKRGFLIHSIKRLSDGEVFTIGDKVRDSATDNLTNNKIQTINYFSTGNCPDGTSYFTICFKSGTTSGLSTIFKCKKPLFTTEDGVDIYKSDIYQVVNSKTLKFCGTQSHGYNSKPPYKTFSTKEAAEEYILMNKPCLSINDVLGLVPHLKSQLINLIKN